MEQVKLMTYHLEIGESIRSHFKRNLVHPGVYDVALQSERAASLFKRLRSGNIKGTSRL
ncbi:hypothetical protein KHA80_01950 [Anaerobacillus sp. HL2]|nr:hypothetical protein KHA80_01950 [Anaerobacillus sp. HL2]